MKRASYVDFAIWSHHEAVVNPKFILHNTYYTIVDAYLDQCLPATTTQVQPLPNR